MERLTKWSKETTHENGVCCTHFGGMECFARNADLPQQALPMQQAQCRRRRLLLLRRTEGWRCEEWLR